METRVTGSDENSLAEPSRGHYLFRDVEQVKEIATR